VAEVKVKKLLSRGVVSPVVPGPAVSKSFLLLFFKKEALPFLQAVPARKEVVNVGICRHDELGVDGGGGC
jgi:hypothetical protein